MGVASSKDVEAGHDKHSQRRKHRAAFQEEIARFRTEEVAAQAARRPRPPSAGGIKVVVRKRPLFEHEAADGDFDTVTAGGGSVWLHDCEMRADFRHKYIDHHEFLFDAAFSEAPPSPKSDDDDWGMILG